MAGLSVKDKEALSYLYELPEFSSFKKWCRTKRLRVAELLMQQDMSAPGSQQKVAMLQGQAYAFEVLLLELQKIHKKQVEKATHEEQR